MFIWPQLLLQYAPMQGPELMSKQNIISLRFLSIILENVECFFSIVLILYANGDNILKQTFYIQNGFTQRTGVFRLKVA